ncbi:regulatory protein RecX [Arthrobacter pityocampae]|uniref:regulatory protein RecX n=1 Tax=Arthrobacter pityocampae TaxID=547334 RepID=UPI001F4DB550|nr:regulatory protein RecX [Arthrobacter pityocampae]
MASETGPDPGGWGTSYDLFGSDSSAEPASPEQPRPPRSARQKSSRSASSFSRSTSARGQGTPRARRRGGPSGRASFDDPFGPVVGASADADLPDGALADDARPDEALFDSPEAGDGDDTGRRARGGGRRSPGARRGRRGDGGSPGGAGNSRTGADPRDTADDAASGEDAHIRTDEEWTSLARSVLLRQLALGARSRHQLERKLAERDVPSPIATALLDRFEEVQLIDDAEFARMWVRTRTAAKSLSRSSLRRELADKGIDADLAEDALLQLSDEDEDEQARDVVRRKLRRSADLADRTVREKEMKRLVGVLARKGYSPGRAFSIVRDVIADAG